MQPTSCKKPTCHKTLLTSPYTFPPIKKNTSKHQRTNPRALGTALRKRFTFTVDKLEGRFGGGGSSWLRHGGVGSSAAAPVAPTALPGSVQSPPSWLGPLGSVHSPGSPLEKQNKTCWRQQNGKNSATFWFTLSEAQWPKKKHVAWCQPAWAQVFEMYAPVCMANILPSTGASSVASIP